MRNLLVQLLGSPEIGKVPASTMGDVGLDASMGVALEHELLLRPIACPLEHFDAIGFAAGRVEDFAVAYALESGAHQADSQHVAGRI